jgi:hypothetical protein
MKQKTTLNILSTLEKFIEPLYTGTPQQIIETLPALDECYQNDSYYCKIL